MAAQKVRVSADLYTQVALACIGALGAFALNFLGHIANDMADLKTSVAVIAHSQGADEHDIQELKTAVFNGKP